MQAVTAVSGHERAIRSVAGLLGAQRIDFVFAGSVARSAWLGQGVESGSIDVIAVLGPQQKNQVAMMANNRGFAVDREELEATEELDLIPMKFEDVRVHVLVASNALYGRMVADGSPAALGDLEFKVPRREDFALLLQMNDEDGSVGVLIDDPAFNRPEYNRKLVSLGLRSRVLPE